MYENQKELLITPVNIEIVSVWNSKVNPIDIGWIIIIKANLVVIIRIVKPETISKNSLIENINFGD